MFRDYVESHELKQAFENHRIETNQKVGRAGNEKGARAEQRLVACLRRATKSMQFIIRVRHATKDEDAHGIDAVAETTIGSLFIQVKSSRCGARRFRKKKRKAHIVIIIVKSDSSDMEIEHMACEKLKRIKKTILCLRRKRKSKTRIH